MGLYLGIDAGTQSIKGILIEPETGKATRPVSVHFGRELPQYASPDGFLPNDNPAIRHANPLMWLDAMDLLLCKMHQAGLPMKEVCGLSGSGQQHGTVYLNEQFEERLASLRPELSLSEQLRPTLSRESAPIWMDASTGEQCRLLRETFGNAIRQRTGSDATERFSGPQIMKFAAEHPEAWRKTSTVHLVSSFLASVLAGESMPIDYGDGAGMNLLNLKKLSWDQEIVEFAAPGLARKLPLCVPSTKVSGKLSPYFAKYGLRPGIPVNVWSGDNPNSLIGSGAMPGDAVISLGTSDTLFATLRSFEDAPKRCGHVFGNPAGGFMTLLCFSNGSLTREAFRKKYALSHDEFDATAENAQPAKYQMVPYLFPEATPPGMATGVRCNFNESTANAATMLRALVESQMLTMRLHAELKETPARIRLVGGASASPFLQKTIANVFQTTTETVDTTETAAFGAAMRAANSIGGEPFQRLVERFCHVRQSISPDASLAKDYEQALESYRILLYEG